MLSCLAGESFHQNILIPHPLQQGKVKQSARVFKQPRRNNLYFKTFPRSYIFDGKASLLTAEDTSQRHTVSIGVKICIIFVGKEQNVLLMPKLLLYPQINHGEKTEDRENVLDTFCLNTMIYLQGQRNVRSSAVPQ